MTESAQCSSLRFISWDLGPHAEEGVQINGKKISYSQVCNKIVAPAVLFWGTLMDEDSLSLLTSTSPPVLRTTVIQALG